MSRVGNPYDNAKAERFMRTLKTEQIDGTLYRDRTHASAAIGDFIDRIYNGQRLHTALDYRSPAQFEACHRANLLPGVGDAARGEGSATPTPNLPLDPKTPGPKHRHETAARIFTVSLTGCASKRLSGIPGISGREPGVGVFADPQAVVGRSSMAISSVIPSGAA